jgi:hypothetical protein
MRPTAALRFSDLPRDERWQLSGCALAVLLPGGQEHGAMRIECRQILLATSPPDPFSRKGT